MGSEDGIDHLASQERYDKEFEEAAVNLKRLIVNLANKLEKPMDHEEEVKGVLFGVDILWGMYERTRDHLMEGLMLAVVMLEEKVKKNAFEEDKFVQ